LPCLCGECLLEFFAGVDAEFLVDVAEVVFDGLRAEEQRGRGLPAAAVKIAWPRITGPYPWDEVLPTDEGWAKDNLYYWLRDYRGFLEFFFSQMFAEPHSTKPIEDCIG
jgi:hypothetical protein